MSETIDEVATAGPRPTAKRLTRGQLVLRRFLRNKGAVFGLVIIAVLVLANTSCRGATT